MAPKKPTKKTATDEAPEIKEGSATHAAPVAKVSAKDGKDEPDFVESASEIVPTFIRTGCMLFDFAISNGRGMPVGGCIVMYSNPGGGKTTLSMDVIRKLIKRHEVAGIPYRVVYIDSEASKSLVDNMGLTDYCVNKTILYKSGQTSFKQLEAMSLAIEAGKPKYKDVKLLAIDSLNYIICEKEKENSIEKGDFGNNASARTKFLRIRLSALKTLGVSIMLICQVRTNTNAGLFGDPKKIAASDADLHFADVIMKVSAAESASNKGIEKVKIKTLTGVGQEEITSGYIISIKSTGSPRKNRYNKLPEVKGFCEPGFGIDNLYNIKEVLENAGYIKISGSGAKGVVGIAPELIACTDDTIPEELRLFQFNKWVRNNMGQIMDFIVQKVLYRVTADSVAIHNMCRAITEEDYK